MPHIKPRTQSANPAPALALVIPPESPESLTPEEATRLAKLERMMELGMERFLGVGKALIEIKEGRLYRGKYPSFLAYCEQRWNMSGRHGYRLIQAYEAQLELADVTRGSRDPDRIKIDDSAHLSAKALCALAPVDKAQKREIVEAAKASNNGEATAAAINKEILKAGHRKQPAKPKPRETLKLEPERQMPAPAVENPAGAPQGAVGGLGSAPASADREVSRTEWERMKGKRNGKPKPTQKRPAKLPTASKKTAAYLSAYDEWQDKSAARWQRDFGARAWRAYNAQVFGILREVREWWAGKLEGGV